MGASSGPFPSGPDWSTGSKRNFSITKLVTASAVLALAVAVPAKAAVPDPVAAALCEEKGEGTHTLRYPTGAVKIRAVCREGKTGTDVRYAWFFDERGRQLKEEDLVPGKPARSRIVEKDYDLHATEVIATRVYDGKGTLLESSGGAETAPERPGLPRIARGSSTKAEYFTACVEAPNALLYPMMGAEKDPQFFTTAACDCVAERAVRADEAPLGKVWQKQESLDPTSMKDRLSVAAMQNLESCLCPEAFPDSRLERICANAAEFEKAWK